MSNKLKYLLALAATSVCALTSCAGETGVDLTANAPDYTRKHAEFLTFGYTPPTNGKYYENGLEIDTGTDFRTKERYEEYKNAGLNVLMLQSEDQYDYWTGDWEKSELKAKMDIIESAGIDKIIVCDARIEDLCNADNAIISEDGDYIKVGGKTIQDGLRQFKDNEALSAYIAKLISPYYYHNAFYGVILRDEPFYYHLPNWCAVYKAIKTFDSRIYIEGNLLPYGTSSAHLERLAPEGKTMTPEAAYRWYLNYYIEHAEADRLMMDSYPFLTSSSGSYFKEEHLKGLQILASVCRDNHLQFEAVAQTFGGTSSNSPKWDQCNAASMQWQINSLLGFGTKMFGYFTYWRKVWNNNQSGGEWFTDGTSFITNKGERTQLYYTMQTIHKEMQLLAPVLTNYTYTASSTFVREPVVYPTQYADITEDKFVDFEHSDFKSTDATVALVTEMKDQNNGQHLYMVMNAMNPNLKESDNNIIMDYSIDFGSNYNAVEVYYRGQRKLQLLDNGVYKSTLDAGYAEYIMPYKA